MVILLQMQSGLLVPLRLRLELNPEEHCEWCSHDSMASLGRVKERSFVVEMAGEGRMKEMERMKEKIEGGAFWSFKKKIKPSL